MSQNEYVNAVGQYTDRHTHNRQMDRWDYWSLGGSRSLGRRELGGVKDGQECGCGNMYKYASPPPINPPSPID